MFYYIKLNGLTETANYRKIKNGVSVSWGNTVPYSLQLSNSRILMVQ